MGRRSPAPVGKLTTASGNPSSGSLTTVSASGPRRSALLDEAVSELADPVESTAERSAPAEPLVFGTADVAAAAAVGLGALGSRRVESQPTVPQAISPAAAIVAKVGTGIGGILLPPMRIAMLAGIIEAEGAECWFPYLHPRATRPMAGSAHDAHSRGGRVHLLERRSRLQARPALRQGSRFVCGVARLQPATRLLLWRGAC